MNHKILKLLLLFFCGLISLVLFGCSEKNKIKFYRESAATSILNNINNGNNEDNNNVNNGGTITKSSGIIIYKTKRNSKTEMSLPEQTFGPKDIDFGLPKK